MTELGLRTFAMADRLILYWTLTCSGRWIDTTWQDVFQGRSLGCGCWEMDMDICVCYNTFTLYFLFQQGQALLVIPSVKNITLSQDNARYLVTEDGTVLRRHLSRSSEHCRSHQVRYMSRDHASPSTRLVPASVVARWSFSVPQQSEMRELSAPAL